MNVARNNHCWSSLKKRSQTLTQTLIQRIKGKWIIDAEPSATITTTKIQPDESEELEEGEHLFHSQMWVKGTPLHFIVDSGEPEEPDLS
jgi:hypothetical protein